jgi:hypothetical protein
MGGGKETPRQKMIGMMYLVLTALLALNVAKTILDAFVAIEENIQLGNINEYARGNEKAAMISDKWTIDKSLRAKKVLELVEKLDKETAKCIQLIDQTKLQVLMECKENITIGKGGEEDKSIIVKDRDGIKFNNDAKNPMVTGNPDPIKPLRMKLEWVSGKDKYDDPMRVMGIAKSEQLAKPDEKGKGMLIWEAMINYRGALINTICDASTYIKQSDDTLKSTAKYEFKDPKITKFTSKEDAIKQLGSAPKKDKPGTKSLKTIYENDESTVIEVYLALLKNEMLEHEGKEIHWIGKTFDHAPSVAVIASLSSLQKDILAARAMVIGYLQEKVGGGDYSFNQIVALAVPDNMIVASGQEFMVSVSMAAFDSEKQPIVKPESGGTLVGTPKNGVAKLKFTAPGSGSVKISGTVGVEKKSGGIEYRSYETEVAVAPKNGALELPECNVLYMNYDNIVVPAAPGVTDLSLTGGRPTNYNGKKAFIVRPTAPGKKNLSLSGKGSDGKSVQIGSWPYKVIELPPPVVSTSTISKAGGLVAVKTTSSLNMTYTVLSGICDDTPFNGSSIPGSCLAKIRSGKSVSVILKVRNNKTGLMERPVKGVLKVQ